MVFNLSNAVGLFSTENFTCNLTVAISTCMRKIQTFNSGSSIKTVKLGSLQSAHGNGTPV